MRTVTPPPETPQPLFTSVLLNLIRRPWKLLRLWNWKAAVLSVALRTPIFFVASLHRGLAATLSAIITESVFCMASAGFYGAIVQSFRLAQPEWLTLTFLTALLPAFFQAIEYFLNWIRGTPHLRLAETASAAISAISALFNWYIMRRNTLLVGPEGAQFKSDLARLPKLLLSFVTALPRRWLDRRKSTTFRCAV